MASMSAFFPLDHCEQRYNQSILVKLNTMTVRRVRFVGHLGRHTVADTKQCFHDD